MHVDIAALTSKGQFTIPCKFRDLLRLSAGSKMVRAEQGRIFTNHKRAMSNFG